MNVNPTLRWPPSWANLFRLSPVEQQVVNDFVQVVLNSPRSTSWNVEKWHVAAKKIEERNEVELGGKIWRLPATLYFHYVQGRLVEIFLLTNRKRGGEKYQGGGERTPKPAYCLLKGLLCCKKRMSNGEFAAISYLKEIKSKGLPTIYAIRFHPKKGKWSYFEEHFDRLSINRSIGSSILSGDRRKVWITLQLLMGLHALHTRRIIHEDIKPGNIVLRSDYTVAITDFGMVGRPTAGTSAYFSPQRMALAVTPVDCRNPHELMRPRYEDDYWSLGVFLVELIINTFGRGQFIHPGENIPPLDIILNAHSPGTILGFVKLRNVTPEEVRKEIGRYKQFCLENKKRPKIYQVLWEVVEELLCPTLDPSILLQVLIRKVSEIRELYNPYARLVREVEEVSQVEPSVVSKYQDKKLNASEARLQRLERIVAIFTKFSKQHPRQKEMNSVSTTNSFQGS